MSMNHHGISILDLLPSSTSSQSQLTPLSANQPSFLSTQTSQSLSSSTVTPPPPSSHPMNPTLSTDSIKQTISHGSSSSIVLETFENNHTPISPSQTNENNPPSFPVDITPQPPVKQIVFFIVSSIFNGFLCRSWVV